MIVVSAILKNDLIFTGERHPDIFQKYKSINLKNAVQGFMTDDGVFLNREEAGKHAFECGQTNKIIKVLTSEDLW